MIESDSKLPVSPGDRHLGTDGKSGRLVLVSNRLPVTVETDGAACTVKPSAGGLATALWPMHEEGEGVWAGWPGALPEGSREVRAVMAEFRRRRLLPVKLPESSFDAYYHGFCNSLLWPLFHHFVRLPELDRSWWDAYRRINARFATVLSRVVKPGDRVWVQDYHLMLLPGLLRRAVPGLQIGFFLHTPFPSSEVFRIIPWRRELLEGLLGADLIGFQVYDHLRHFRSSVARVLDREAPEDQVVLEDRTVRLGSFPIGIDPDRFYSCATADADALDAAKELEETLRGRKLVLGVDRMDYTKGIPERLRAFERFLERYPSLREKVELVQIGVPTRMDVPEYQALREEVEGLVGHINGRFGSQVWTPVKYLFRPIPFPRLCALYRAAKVGLVTPLRDGMNLVAKEFVACQRDGGEGMLVLSEFAGAAAELPEAVLVNPYDADGVAAALNRALTMGRRERHDRMTSLVRRVWDGDVAGWGDRFLGTLDRCVAEGVTGAPPRLEGPPRNEFLTAWSVAWDRLLLLDYDGTLRTFAKRPQLARPDRELLGLLRALAAVPGVEVAVVSGRDRATLARWLGRLPVTLIAEHGRWLRQRGGAWEDLLGGRVPPWLDAAHELMAETSAAVPGSLVEGKSASVAWHYRTANVEQAARRVGELVEELNDLPGQPSPEVLHGHKVVEVRVAGVSKSSAVVSLLARLPAMGLILAAGDDRTDEDLFAQLPFSAWTIHVGSRLSRARFSLPDVPSFRTLLAELVRRVDSAGKEATR